MSKPWSKLKSRIEALWIPQLNMAIHCNSYTHRTTHDTYEIPRHWIVLNKETIWDFPFPFIAPNIAPRNTSPISDYYSAYNAWDTAPKPVLPLAANQWDWSQSSIIAIILRHYLDRPREGLLDPFPEDEWELTDILRAADARIGRTKLENWAKTLPDGHPAFLVLMKRGILIDRLPN